VSGPARTRDSLAVLLLCDDSPAHAPNVLEHIRALQRFSRHTVHRFNPLGVGRPRRLGLGDYDVVAIHYTVSVIHDTYLAPWLREQIAGFGGLKVQFIQDEYRRVDATTERMRELGIDLVYSSIPPDVVPLVYGPRLPGVDVLSTLTGYVPAELGRRPPVSTRAGRTLDVVYRGRSIPYWLGRLGQDKVLIGREFLARAASTGLRCDISSSEADRIYGDAWYRFLGSSRTTLGTESGASIVDFDGSLQERTEAYLTAHPAAPFDEVEREILAPFEGNAVIQAISPRVFEAAALGTAMVNFAGRYSDVIEPWVHYVPLEKDFSNFDEVVAAVEDDALVDRIASQAYDDLVASGRYSLEHFVDEVDRDFETRAPERRRPRSRARDAYNGKRLQLERLRTSGRVGGRSPLAPLRAASAERFGRRLVRRFPEIETLAASADAGKRRRLHDDLVRLAAASAVHLRELRDPGTPFDVVLELDDSSRRLTLVSVATASHTSTPPERIESAIRDRRLEEIVWNHSPVSTTLVFPVPILWPSLEIGYHVVAGAHSFTAVAEIARTDPDAVIGALQPLLRPRPTGPVRELGSRLATLSKPGRAVARGVTTLGVVSASKEHRRLLRAYLASPGARAEVPLDLLLKELFRLRLAGKAQAVPELSADGASLVYRAPGDSPSGGGPLDTQAVRSLERIVWADRYELAALAAMARRFPELVAPLLPRPGRE